MTPSTATRNGGLPGRRVISSLSSASGNGAAKAMTPCGASLRARASSLPRATLATGTRFDAGEGDDVGDGIVGLAVAADQLGRQPQLVDTTPPGDEQLTHRLASLDLLAAETLAAALRRVRRTAVATAHRTGAPGAPAPRRRRP